MPFVRVVDPDPGLAHQLHLAFAPGYKEYNVSCNCMPARGNGRMPLTTISMERLVQSGMLASRELIRIWQEAHNPPLEDEVVTEATSYRWAWVDGGQEVPGIGAEQP